MFNITGWVVLVVLTIIIGLITKSIYKRMNSKRTRLGTVIVGALIFVLVFANINCVSSTFVFSRVLTDCAYAPGDIEGMTTYSPEIRIIHVKELSKNNQYNVLLDTDTFPMDSYIYETDTLGVLKGSMLDVDETRVTVINNCFKRVVRSTCVKNEELEVGKVYLAFGHPSSDASFFAGYYVMLDGFNIEKSYHDQDTLITKLLEEVLNYVE